VVNTKLNPLHNSITTILSGASGQQKATGNSLKP